MGQGIGGHRVGELGGGRDQPFKSLSATGRGNCPLEGSGIAARFHQGRPQA